MLFVVFCQERVPHHHAQKRERASHKREESVCVLCSMLISGGGYGFWGVLEDGLSAGSV
jgi:hypothetical protein